MDPVTALSLSCNILQLIKDAASTGRIVYKICKTGKFEGIDDFDNALRDFDKLIETSQNLSTQSSLDAQIESARKLVVQTLQTCSTDAKTLRTELQKFKCSQDGVRRLGFAFKAAFTGSASKVSEASSRLEKARDWLNTSFLPVVVANVQTMLSKQQIAFSDLNKASQDMLQLRSKRFDDIESNLHDIESSMIGHIDSIQAKTISARHHEQVRTQLLASISFPEMNDRISSISAHSESTFDWILDPMCESAAGSFSSWLVGSESHFWIQGKAGSGKSTLMKRLWSDDYVVRLLALHDEGASVLILKHSFWLSTSNDLRKNYKGMLCALIRDIVSTSPAAVDWFKSERTSTHRFKTCGDWEEKSLESTFFALLENRSVCQFVCIFLDALDEISDEVEKRKVLQLILKLSLPQHDHVKICTSSRPERPWLDKFRSTCHLSLETLTRHDIEAYARSHLEGVLPVEHGTERGEVNRFFKYFASRAEGVFLWAHLAVQSLLGISAHGSWLEVKELLAQLPSDMMQLYNNILSRRAKDAESVKAEAATYLRLGLWNSRLRHKLLSVYNGKVWVHAALLVWRSYFNKEDYYSTTNAAKYHYHYNATEERILDICGGLLKPQYFGHLFDASNNVYDPINDSDLSRYRQQRQAGLMDLRATSFVFSHRTAADFLSDTPEGREFVNRANMTLFDMLLLRIDAEMLLCRLSYTETCSFRHIAFERVVFMLVDAIAGFRKNYTAADRDLKVIQAMQRLQEGVSLVEMQHYNTSSLRKTNLASSLVYDLAANLQSSGSDLYRNNRIIAHDIPGLFLEFGMDQWFNTEQAQYLEHTTTSLKHMTSEYKAYLLVCAVRGNLPYVVKRLLVSGGDPGLELYLPLRNPARRSAAAELLALTLSSNMSRMEDDLGIWQALVGQLSSRKQYLVVTPSWGLFGSDCVCISYFFVGRPLSKPLCLLLDVHANLKLWLQHETISSGGLFPKINGGDCVGFILMEHADDPEYSIQPFFASSWAGFSLANASVEAGRWQSNIATTVFTRSLNSRCPKCLADSGAGCWRRLQLSTPLQVRHTHHEAHGCIKLRSFQSPQWPIFVVRYGALSETPLELTGKRGFWFEAMLAERGFTALPTDPRVAQAPFVMYETVTSSPSSALAKEKDHEN